MRWASNVDSSNPNFDRLEGREFIEAPPLKYDDDEKKPRGRRNSRNNKRSRRYRKSNGYKSQKSGENENQNHKRKKNTIIVIRKR